MKVKLESVASVYNGKTPARTEQRTTGYPVLKIKNVDENGFFRGTFESFVDDDFVRMYGSKKIRAGDVMILNAAHNADYVGSKLFFAVDSVADALPTGEWAIIRSDSAKLLPRYCYFFFSSEYGRTAVKNIVRGIHLYPTDLKATDIPLPPLPEQQRIVRILDEADALRQLRARADARTDDFIPALFNEMFGDPATNPKGWDIVTTQELFAEDRAGTRCGPFGSALKKHEYVERGIPVWGIDNVLPNEFVEEGSLFITPEKYKQLANYSVESGDILISRAGTVGRMCVARPKQSPSIIGSNLIRLSFLEFRLTPNGSVLPSL